MLVLSRKVGEQIILPESGILISVLAVHGRRVRLGVEAPPSTTVHRAEVWQRILELAPLNPESPHVAKPSCEFSAP